MYPKDIVAGIKWIRERFPTARELFFENRDYPNHNGNVLPNPTVMLLHAELVRGIDAISQNPAAREILEALNFNALLSSTIVPAVAVHHINHQTRDQASEFRGEVYENWLRMTAVEESLQSLLGLQDDDPEDIPTVVSIDVLQFRIGLTQAQQLSKILELVSELAGELASLRPQENLHPVEILRIETGSPIRIEFKLGEGLAKTVECVLNALFRWHYRDIERAERVNKVLSEGVAALRELQRAAAEGTIPKEIPDEAAMRIVKHSLDLFDQGVVPSQFAPHPAEDHDAIDYRNPKLLRGPDDSTES